jgi:hypothetical protein
MALPGRLPYLGHGVIVNPDHAANAATARHRGMQNVALRTPFAAVCELDSELVCSWELRFGAATILMHGGISRGRADSCCHKAVTLALGYIAACILLQQRSE